jgi:CheY-like chemotaxis protein
MGISVLVVDDDDAIRETLRCLLEEEATPSSTRQMASRR